MRTRQASSSAVLLLSLVIVLLNASPGCMMFCPDPSPYRTTQCGRIDFLDYKTCSHMRVTGHTAEPNREGHLVVTVQWLNVTDNTYKARIRVTFFDQRGLRERGGYRWDLQEFPPGKCDPAWTSYTREAASYLIEVKSGG